jgi:hypothetical protein
MVPFLEFIERLLDKSSVERQALDNSKCECNLNCEYKLHKLTALEHYPRITRGPKPHLIPFC